MVLLWMHIVCMILILLFSLFYSLNLILTPKSSIIIKVICIMVLLAVLYIGVNRNTYLPFLGYAAMPPSVFIEGSPKDASNEAIIRVDAPNGSKVVYWAATDSGNDTIAANPYIAYGDYSNSGVAIVENKRALLHFHCPDRYNVNKYTIDKHVHYRVIEVNNPIMSPVYTKYVRCREANNT